MSATAKWLGHDPAMTPRMYGHVYDDSLKSAGAALFGDTDASRIAGPCAPAGTFGTMGHYRRASGTVFMPLTCRISVGVEGFEPRPLVCKTCGLALCRIQLEQQTCR